MSPGIFNGWNASSRPNSSQGSGAIEQGAQDVDTFRDIASRTVGIGGSEHQKLWRKERSRIVDSYRQERRRTMQEFRREERKLQEDLKRKKDDIDSRYRLHKIKEGHPKYEWGKRRAAEEYKELQTKEERKFRRDRQARLRKLKLAKNQDVRGLSKRLRGEYKRVPPSSAGGLAA